MNSQESLDLKKLLAGFQDEYQDNTEYIRRVKHSDSIREDIDKLTQLKQDKGQILKTAPNKFMELAQSTAFFLFKNYTDIFNKVIKDELDMDIMSQVLVVLKQIENGEVDQNEGSIRIGTLLKELYVDSALKIGAKLDVEHPKEEKKDGRNIDWKSWKKSGFIERRKQIMHSLSF